jgi:hypothetical protein
MWASDPIEKGDEEEPLIADKVLLSPALLMMRGFDQGM